MHKAFPFHPREKILVFEKGRIGFKKMKMEDALENALNDE